MKYSEKLDCDMVNLTKTWLFFKANRAAINDKIYSYNTTIIPYQNQRSNRNIGSLTKVKYLIIPYQNQRSNRNYGETYTRQVTLYHIKIKDQTAT